MAFDIGNGLSEMGKSVAQTAQAWTLETQKAELDKEKVKLADQLAGAREEKQRGFLSSEREKTQAWQGGENALNRSSAKDIAQLQADTAVKTAGISAGATLGAAKMRIDADAPVRDAQIKAYDAETLQKTIATEAAKNLQEAKKSLEKAMLSGDPNELNTAKTKLYAAEVGSKDETQRVSLFQAQAKLIADAMTATQTKLVALQDPVKMMDPGAKALADQLNKELERLRGEHSAAVRAADQALKNLPTGSPTGAASSGAPDLNKYLKPPPTPVKGLIDTPAGGP